MSWFENDLKFFKVSPQNTVVPWGYDLRLYLLEASKFPRFIYS
jgi:hypothetical protein